MIRHLRHTEIDKAWWDERLLWLTNRSWYARSEVLDIVSPGWEALVDNKACTIMPLTWRTKYGVSYLFQPFAIQRLGVFGPEGTSSDQCNAFLRAIPARFRYINIRLNPSHGQEETSHTRTSRNFILELASPYEALREGYGKGHRRNLAKALPAGIVHTTEASVDEFVQFYEQTTAVRFGGLKPRDRQTLVQLIGFALRNEEGRIVGMRANGTLIAAACFITWHGRSIFLKSAASAEGLAVNAMFHIIDGWVREHAGSSMILDFAGSNDPGAARFYEGFGARSELYLNVRWNRLPLPLKWLKR